MINLSTSFYKTAHCLIGKTISASNVIIRIRAGSAQSNSGGELVQVSKTILHENFDKKTFDYDIALLKLEKKLKFSSNIKAIELPKKMILLVKKLKLPSQAGAM